MAKSMNEIKRELEAFVDASSLASVIQLLTEICDEKAMHIKENWQDYPLAKTWERDSAALWTASTKLNN